MTSESHQANRLDPFLSVKNGSEEESSEDSNLEDERRRKLPCTCRQPLCVELRGDGATCDETNRDTFIENLRTLGWSPVAVCNAPHPAPTRENVLSIFCHRHERDPISKEIDIEYIPAESGSSKGAIEPKESLEIKLSKCTADSNLKPCSNFSESDRDERIVKRWCWTLSWISHRICTVMLRLPENTFLPHDPNNSLDLLRVFHYYTVPSDASSFPSTFGSSEHTDWGSLTVVWQDNVGGLQTFCRACEKWIDVRVEPDVDGQTTETNSGESNHRWQCIVHVGDMASLILGASSDSLLKETSIDTSNYVSSLWPSPKHRVVSPMQNERVSLVYFGYPPREMSMCQIQSVLDDEWQYSSKRGRHLPLEEYYLLRNQSAANRDREDPLGTNEDSESKRLYSKMWDLPIEDIVRLKWEQVRR